MKSKLIKNHYTGASKKNRVITEQEDIISISTGIDILFAGFVLANPFDIFMKATAWPRAITKTLYQFSQPQEAELWEFVCLYNSEIDASFAHIKMRIIKAIKEAHWSAFDLQNLVNDLSESVAQRLCEKTRADVLSLMRSGDARGFTGPAVLAINRNAAYVDGVFPNFFSNGAEDQSRMEWGLYLDGANILEGCDHNMGRAMVFAAGTLMKMIEAISHRTLYGTDLGMLLQGHQTDDLKRMLSTKVNMTGQQSDGTGVAQIIYDINSVTAKDKPIRGGGLLDIAVEGGLSVWNEAWGLLDIEQPMVEDECGKLPCPVSYNPD